MQIGTGFMWTRNCLLKTLRCCCDFLIPVSQAGHPESVILLQNQHLDKHSPHILSTLVV